MSSEKSPVSSKEALNEELQALLLEAYRNGVDVEGGFDCRNGAGHPDWDVVVTEVLKKDASE